MAVFWDVALCFVVGTDTRFSGFYCLRHQGNECRLFSLRHENQKSRKCVYCRFNRILGLLEELSLQRNWLSYYLVLTVLRVFCTSRGR